MSTWNLVRIFMMKMAAFLRKRMLEVEETSQTATMTWVNALGVGVMLTMATMKYVKISWWGLVYELVPGKGMFQTLGVEVMLLEGYSTMATWTLARKYIRISGRELVYKFVSGMETYQTLGVEVTWKKDKSTMAALVREHIKIFWLEVLV
jgi:hypothetical protein